MAEQNQMKEKKIIESRQSEVQIKNTNKSSKVI